MTLNNPNQPDRCIIRLYKLYNSKCPSNRPSGAFYLYPLTNPRGDIWYSKSAVGHNVLQQTVPKLMKEAGYDGYYTNHSLRVLTTATRLFNEGVDEQLIMARTWHSSTDGVRAYKRTSDKLKELTSDVLNCGTKSASVPEKSIVAKSGTKKMKLEHDSNELEIENKRSVLCLVLHLLFKFLEVLSHLIFNTNPHVNLQELKFNVNV